MQLIPPIETPEDNEVMEDLTIKIAESVEAATFSK